MKKGIDYTGITVVFFCLDKDNNLLMAKRSIKCRDEHHKWDCGGGGLEFGDDVVDTLKKEIKEEYCTDVLDHSFLGYRIINREHDGKKTHWLALDFKVVVDRDKVQNGEPHKFDDLRWFNLDNLPNNTHSQFPTFLEKYKEKLQ